MDANLLKQPESAKSTGYVLQGTVITDGSVHPGNVVAVRDDRIVYVGPPDDCDASYLEEATPVTVPEGGAILPGLVDVHCHGAAGAEFPSGNTDASRAAVDFLHDSGTTTLLASLVTASDSNLIRAIRGLRPLAAEGLIDGLHLEGPFLSRARCGAQNPLWLRDPDFELLDELLQAADGTIKSMTYAPELPRADELLKTLIAHGITPSLGHTDCTAEVAANSLETAESAMKNVYPMGQARPTVTHLFNGMAPMHHRLLGPVGACLRLANEGRIAVELIADGVHLDAQTVLMTFGLVGAANVLLVTDSMAATGLPDGDYELGPSQVSVQRGVARLRDGGSLAGGTATLLDVVRHTIAAGVSPGDAVLAATAVPARMLGAGADIGSVKRGMRADLVVVDAGFRPHTVMRAGVIRARE
ncbi:N-acetylglucosamine-6-phosphate deacetylase [Pseudarthrobacter sp. AL20]